MALQKQWLLSLRDRAVKVENEVKLLQHNSQGAPAPYDFSENETLTPLKSAIKALCNELNKAIDEAGP